MLVETSPPMLLCVVQNACSADFLPKGLPRKRSRGEDHSVEKKLLRAERRWVTLPDHAAFGDFAEMVVQFGCMSLWLTIRPLTPAIPFLNNWVGDHSRSSNCF